MPVLTVDEHTAATAFCELAARVVWAQVATVDAHGRPWTRVLHPLWRLDPSGLTGLVLTRPTRLKRYHLAAHPHVAVGYWHPDHSSATANCCAAWGDQADVAEAWDTARHLPAPYGYDPAVIWPGGPGAADCAVLVLTAWRLSAATGEQAATGGGVRWTAPPIDARLPAGGSRR